MLTKKMKVGTNDYNRAMNTIALINLLADLNVRDARWLSIMVLSTLFNVGQCDQIKKTVIDHQECNFCLSIFFANLLYFDVSMVMVIFIFRKV